MCRLRPAGSPFVATSDPEVQRGGGVGLEAQAFERGEIGRLDLDFGFARDSPLPAPPKDGYLPLRARHLLHRSESPFDLFLRIGEGSYLKLFYQDQVFDAERLSRYLRCGLEFLYVEEERRSELLKACDSFQRKLHGRSPLDHSVHFGEQVLRLIGDQTDPATVEHAEKFVRDLGSSLKCYDAESCPEVVGLLANLHAYEHGVAVAVVALLIVAYLLILHMSPACPLIGRSGGCSRL